MRIYMVDGYGVRLGYRDGAMTVAGREGAARVPLSDVDMIVVATSGVSVSSALVRALARAGIDLVFLGPNGMPVAITYSSEPTLTVETRRAQYRAALDGRGARLAAEFAASKVHNQALHLERLYQRLRDPLLREAAEAVRGYEAMLESLEEPDARTVMKLEAAAAREYWGALARTLPGDLGFPGRSHESLDPVNASLNYAYAILYTIAWKALLLAGLDPYAGYLHTDRSGKPVLVFDYVECWRPVIVDQPLTQALLAGWRPRLRDARLDVESRRRIAATVKERLEKRCSGWNGSCRDALRSYALRLAKALREARAYKCYRGW